MSLSSELRATFAPHTCASNAAGMQRYMRDQFAFIGLKTPLRQQLEREVFKACGALTEGELERTLRELWQQPEREFQYAAIELAKRYRGQLDRGFLATYDWMIRHKSWWDTVDAIASWLVGSWVERFDPAGRVMNAWAQDANLWIRRSALLHQLKYKSATDAERLFGYCEQMAGEQDFFIRKAIGWALREYSKTDPDAVRGFLDRMGDQLSPLSRREGGKLV